MEESWLLRPSLAAQYARPYFSLPSVKSGFATRDYHGHLVADECDALRNYGSNPYALIFTHFKS